MQMMITPGLYDHSGLQYVDGSFAVVVLDDVNTVGVLDLPRRWTSFSEGAGTSDHFPIAARCRTVEDGDTSERLVPSGPGREEDAPTKLMKVGFASLEKDDVPAFEPAYGKDLRQQLRSYPEEGRLEFIGELATHRGQWQFIVGDEDWILKEPKPAED
jgi:hypothetical protein